MTIKDPLAGIRWADTLSQSREDAEDEPAEEGLSSAQSALWWKLPRCADRAVGNWKLRTLGFPESGERPERRPGVSFKGERFDSS